MFIPIEVVLMLLSGGALFFLAPALVSIFSNSQEVSLLGITVLRMVALSEPFYGFSIIMEGMMLGAIMAALGHIFPMLLGFKGGKGVLCGATAVFMLDWRIGLVLAVVFFGSVLATRYVSLGSILAAIGFGIGFSVLYWDHPWVVAGGIFLAALVIWMHRSNILRLLKGPENKFTIRKKEKTE